MALTGTRPWFPEANMVPSHVSPGPVSLTISRSFFLKNSCSSSSSSSSFLVYRALAKKDPVKGTVHVPLMQLLLVSILPPATTLKLKISKRALPRKHDSRNTHTHTHYVNALLINFCLCCKL